jgi:hypothetical protein
MATEKWIAGTVGLTWTAAYTSAATFDSIASGNAIISDLQIDNSSNLDLFYDVAIILGSAAFVAPNYIGIYLYPLTQDGTTYGDGRFGTSAAGPPAATYFVGAVQIVAATQAQTGALLAVNNPIPLIMPPGKFKFLIHNQGGVTLAGSGGNKIYYRTYNRSVA